MEIPYLDSEKNLKRKPAVNLNFAYVDSGSYMIQNDHKMNQLSALRNLERLMILNDSQQQAERPENDFTHKKAEVEFLTGGYTTFALDQ